MARTRVVRMIAALTAASALALSAGCAGSSPEAGTAENKKPSAGEPAPTKSPKTGGTTGTIDDVSAKDQAEIKTFVQRYLDAVEEAYKTQSTTKMDAMYTDDCRECSGPGEGFKTFKSWGFKLQGTRTYVDPVIKVVGLENKDAVLVRVETGISPYKVLRKDGSVEKSYGVTKGSKTEDVFVKRTPEGWRVVAWHPLGG